MNREQANKIKYDISKKLIEKYRSMQYQHMLPRCTSYTDIKYHSGLPYLELPINVPVNKILQELHNVKKYFVNHRDEYQEHKGWKSFCIHGKDYNATRETGFYNDNRPFVFTDLAKYHMSSTVKYFSESFPYQSYERVRIMLLEPGGYITVHNDYDQKRLSPINIALTQPNGCDFVMNKIGLVPFRVGSAMWLDISNSHTVFNNSNQPRYHIIVHGEPNQNFKNLVEQHYNFLYNKQL